MLDREGSKYIGRFGELKYLLAPYLVKNAAEQQRFYQLWDEFTAECTAETAPTPQEQTEQQATTLPWYLRYRRWLLALVLLPILIGIAVSYFKVAMPEREIKVLIAPNVEAIAREGNKLDLRNGTNISRNPADSSLFNWEVKDAKRDSILFTSTEFHLDWTIPSGTGRQLLVTLAAPELERARPENQTATFNTTVYCASPPSLDSLAFPTGPFNVGETARFQVFIPDEYTVYKWTFGEEDSSADLVDISHTFEAEGPLMIQLKAMSQGPDSAYCFTTYIQQVQVGSNQPFLATLPMIIDEATQQLQLAPMLWLLFLIPFLFSLPLWYRWWKKRNPGDQQGDRSPEELQAAYPIHDAGPYDIPFRNQEKLISAPADFFRIADQLRIRTAGLRRTFDAQGTVDATIQGGGFPVWRDKPIKRPAAYLMLLRHTDEHQQQDRLLSRLADFLLAREAELTVYYHSGKFDHFWNADYPEGWPLEQLYSRYPEHRLIVGGNAHGLIDAYVSEQPRLLPEFRRQFTRWNRRLVLTTEPVSDWSFQEVLLHQDFLLYPATSNGIQTGIFDLNETEEYEAGNYPNWESELAKLHPEPSYRYRKWETTNDHQQYLADDPELFRWLCGLAVTSTPNWNLTIAIGRALGIDVTHNRLLRLSRIPWLANNRPKHELRFALLALLDEADEQLARQCILDELDAVAPLVENSFAQTDWTTSTTLQKFALAPTKPANKQAVRDLRALGYFSTDQLDELDQALLSKSDLATPVKSGSRDLKSEPGNTTTLNAWLDAPEPRPWFTWELAVAMLLSLITFVCTMWGNDFNQAAKPFNEANLPWWQVTKTTVDEARELNNLAVAEWKTVAAIDDGSQLDFIEATADSAAAMLMRAVEIRKPDYYATADTNQLILLYNAYTKNFNAYLRDSIDGATWSAGQPDENLQSLLNNFTGPDSLSRRGLYVRHALGLAQLRLFNYYLLSEKTDSLALSDRVNFSRTSNAPIPEAYRLFFDGTKYINLLEFPPGQLLINAVNHYAFLDTVAGGTFFPVIEGYQPSAKEREKNPDIAMIADALTEMPYNLRTEIQPYLKRLSAEEKSTPPRQEAATVEFSRIEKERQQRLDEEQKQRIQEIERLKRLAEEAAITDGKVTSPSPDPTDPFDRMILNWRTKKYSRTLVKINQRNYESELTSYLTSTIRNDAKTTVTSVDNYLKLIQRDLSNVAVTNNYGHQTDAQFLRLGKLDALNYSQIESLRQTSLTLLVNNYQYLRYPSMSDLKQEVQSLQQALSSNGSGPTTELVENLSKTELFQKIQTYGDMLSKQRATTTGQFMLFITGYFDEKRQAIVLEPDGKVRERQYVTLQELKDQIESVIPAKHVLIIGNFTELPY